MVAPCCPPTSSRCARPSSPGERAADDYQVIWDELSIGRILKQPGVPPGRPNWFWGVHFPHKPQPAGHRGLCRGLEECKKSFRLAWSALYRDLTEEDVRLAREQAKHLVSRPWNRPPGIRGDVSLGTPHTISMP